MKAPSWNDFDLPALLAHCDFLIAAYDADLAIIEQALWIMRPLAEETQTVFRFVRDDEATGGQESYEILRSRLA